MKLALMFAASSCVASLVSCSSTDPAPPAALDLTKPVVSFKADVGPVFKRSCAFGSCHGSVSGSNNGIYVGDEAKAFIAGAVGKPATQLASMSYVTKGDPKQSYLMYKIDGDFTSIKAKCSGGSCQDPMPKGSDPLPQTERDAIRRWIAQGCADN